MDLINEIKLGNRILRGNTTSYDLKINDDGIIELEIPLKERYRNMSIRIPEETLIKIDKMVVVSQQKTSDRITRSELIREIIEVLGELFASMNYDIDRITITCRNKNVSRSISIKITEVEQ